MSKNPDSMREGRTHTSETIGEEIRERLGEMTPSERRVARMAADGLTNRQIAGELVVTVKAVEWHLSHVYRKLGVPNRTGLAATLGEAV